ncbi:MAG: pilus assembly protein TadG-related protein [Pseudomonadota bacterium]
MGKRSFFWALAKDPTANTIAIAAASLVPLVAMVGGAVDASRYYMAASRLQAACDAGALAARKSMDDVDFDPAVHGDIGTDFFEENYNDGLFGLENLNHSYTSPNNDSVVGTASGTLPTTLMHIFGFDGFELNVGCSAEVNISNTDVMFVLDVTGSMSGASGTPGQSRIEALRASVLDFYDAVESTSAQSAQVRYGFVPFSMNVNVGASIPTEFMATNPTLPTRSIAT